MTRDEILAMQPGRELDIEVGKRVLGCHVRKERNRHTFELIVPGGVSYISCVEREDAWCGMPPLSSTWEGMRLVVEAMAARGWWLILSVRGVECEATFVKDSCSDRNAIDGLGQTAPHAVAIAALLALEQPK